MSKNRPASEAQVTVPQQLRNHPKAHFFFLSSVWKEARLVTYAKDGKHNRPTAAKMQQAVNYALNHMTRTSRRWIR